MERLTTNKDVSKMGMYELAHNSCYIKDGKARYRDYDLDVDARENKLIINGKEVKHITIRIGKDGDDVIYIGEQEIINSSDKLKVFIYDENHKLICEK